MSQSTEPHISCHYEFTNLSQKCGKFRIIVHNSLMFWMFTNTSLVTAILVILIGFVTADVFLHSKVQNFGCTGKQVSVRTHQMKSIVLYSLLD